MHTLFYTTRTQGTPMFKTARHVLIKSLLHVFSNEEWHKQMHMVFGKQTPFI